MIISQTPLSLWPPNTEAFVTYGIAVTYRCPCVVFLLPPTSLPQGGCMAPVPTSGYNPFSYLPLCFLTAICFSFIPI